MKIAEKIHKLIDKAYNDQDFEYFFKIEEIATRLKDLKSHQYEKVDTVLFCTYEDNSQLQIDYKEHIVKSVEDRPIDYESLIDPDDIDRGKKYKVAHYKEAGFFWACAWLIDARLNDDPIYESCSMDSLSEALTAKGIMYDLLEGNYKQ